MTHARIAPLEPPYAEPVQAALDHIMPKGVPPLALFRTLAVNQRVFLRVMAGGLLDRGSISLRERRSSSIARAPAAAPSTNGGCTWPSSPSGSV